MSRQIVLFLATSLLKHSWLLHNVKCGGSKHRHSAFGKFSSISMTRNEFLLKKIWEAKRPLWKCNVYFCSQIFSITINFTPPPYTRNPVLINYGRKYLKLPFVKVSEICYIFGFLISIIILIRILINVRSFAYAPLFWF